MDLEKAFDAALENFRIPTLIVLSRPVKGEVVGKFSKPEIMCSALCPRECFEHYCTLDLGHPEEWHAAIASNHDGRAIHVWDRPIMPKVGDVVDIRPEIHCGKGDLSLVCLMPAGHKETYHVAYLRSKYGYGIITHVWEERYA